MKHNLNLVTDPRFAWRTRRFSGYDIPPQEVAELYKLYNHTGGANWTDNMNWFTAKTCANWYGLTVTSGHVTAIDLGSNGLSGEVFSTFVPALPSLATLNLSGNDIESPSWLAGMFALDNTQALNGTAVFTA